MSPAYTTAEQYERWHKRDCARCGRHGCFAGRWPDGHVCRTCHDRALRQHGRCPGCGTDRILPGLRPDDGAAICPDCAGFTMSYACSRCGHEGKLHGGRRCTRCTLADRIAELLDDDTGRIHPRLVPLAEQLRGMDKPLSGLTWLSASRGAAADLLRGLAREEIPLAHEAFRTLQPWRAAAHLRELLMACGLLPAVDKQILLFERWLHEHLAGVVEAEHAQILRRFATWHVLPQLRTRAEVRPISPAGRRYAGEQVLQATALLGWLASHGRQLADCTQADVDAWSVEQANSNRVNVRAFLQWSAKARLTRRFELPAAQSPGGAPMPERDRTALLGHVLADDSSPLRSRVAAVILLLYAQPLSRTTQLTIDDVIRNGDQVLLRLGDPPSPAPGPVAALLLEYLGQRSNMATATNRESRWLFPGRRAGQPLRSDTLSALVHDLGIPATAARAAAIRQHVLDLPAPIVAAALRYHQVTTARLAAEAGTTWSSYAAGANGR
ncbi:hypothetical protein OG989_05660 [Micromonospora sp. NBC_01740]|uniref:hypothetical protein n=1 Tax=Micromonospora sp. NBC_01740 TaxID=2975986 RepID=UPI002E0D5351|nr:hypothetical protein OG989_05660 [Micromonospora sp. NBC_01740]